MTPLVMGLFMQGLKIDKLLFLCLHGNSGPFPYSVPLEAGKDYFWCTCGLSKKQPMYALYIVVVEIKK